MESEPSDGLYLELPSDVWERVFALLSTKEWAMASGTCRAFRGIKLGVVDMDVSSHGALRWAAKHWQASSKLSLNCKASFDYSFLPPEVLTLGDLQFLKVSGGSEHALPMWIGSLLSNCRALEVLMLDFVYPLPFLPPLMHLRHLMLTLPGFSCSFLTSLGMLHGLVSLSLQANKGSFVECPQIDLTSLLGLKDIRIEQIRPNGVVLTEGCALHLVVTSPELIGDALGDCAQIASLEFHDDDEEVWRWPTPLVAHCTSLQWTSRTIGAPGVPLSLSGADFTGLRKLYLESYETIDLHIPASMHLSALHVYTLHVEITFEDVDAAVAELEEVSVAWKFLLMSTNGILKMIPALERQGKIVGYASNMHSLVGYYHICHDDDDSDDDHDDDDSDRKLYHWLSGFYLEGGQGSSSGMGSCSCNACHQCVCSGH